MNKVKSDTFRKSRTKLLISGYFSVHVRETHDFVSVLNFKMCEAISQSKPFKQGRTLPTVKTSKQKNYIIEALKVRNIENFGNNYSIVCVEAFVAFISKRFFLLLITSFNSLNAHDKQGKQYFWQTSLVKIESI